MEWFDNPNGVFWAVKTYLNYILRSCMDDDSNYSYSCMTSSSLIRVVSCIDMPDTPPRGTSQKHCNYRNNVHRHPEPVQECSLRLVSSSRLVSPSLQVSPPPTLASSSVSSFPSTSSSSPLSSAFRVAIYIVVIASPGFAITLWVDQVETKITGR